MSHLHTKIWYNHQKSESYHPCLAQWDKTISEVNVLQFINFISGDVCLHYLH